MALSPQGAVTGVHPVSARHFVRLKLRMMANSFRGQGWRIAIFLSGIVIGGWFAASGFTLLALPGLLGSPQMAGIAGALGGAMLVIGWLLLPLIFFGVDETLDPARFALLPLSRRTLLTGLLAAALVGVPAAATLLATAGLVLSSWALGGWVAGLFAALGIVAGLLLCVTASRAVTSAFANMLRSRKVRDLAAILLAVCAALLGPLQVAVLSAAERADWDQLAVIARVLSWTPIAAPYTIGLDVADGRAWAVPLKLLITAVAIGALLRWWSASLESAMLGTVNVGTEAQAQPAIGGSATAQLFPRVLGWLPRDRYGALVAREARYWWRDTRRRANLITFAVVGIFVPVTVNLGSEGLASGSVGLSASPVLVSLSMVFVGVVAAVTPANQFGWDGSAYAANVIAGVPGRLELRARVVAFSLYVAPLLVVIAVILAFFRQEVGWIGVLAGSLFAAYGSGLAVTLYVSILSPYALPESTNPFAMNSGAGVAKSAQVLLAMVIGSVLALPMVIATALFGDVWLWLALPVGLAYGLGALAVGIRLAGDELDRRMPELLVAITPRR
ncbi:ABC-2 type transport system permease protein [Micromonospora pisi]|uniref:ABC-2 type transport system permease protein n=1 Tax=Micromonospora pisi TaxID=589240 RepID=A0A495JKB6_9ACTN|nr:ABC transporter permease [Micromonospora pisi]RKR89377.1 ABC-2 type transport system permease protein [Micromonospora pisi]